MNYEKIAKEILQCIGGKENISNLTHCVTRLRFVLKDISKVDKESLSKVEGVITVVESIGQLQVVIGNRVKEVYEATIKLIGKVDDFSEKNETNLFSMFLQKFSSIFTPTIPALAGSGMIKGILAILVIIFSSNFGFDFKATDTYKILYGASDAIFYFMPIILGYTSAKTFRTNPYVGMIIGGTLCYPGIVSLLESEKVVNLLGLTVTKAIYTSSVIPIIIAVFILSYVEKALNKIIPDVIKLIVVPAFSLLIMVPATLLLFGPIGIYIGNGISYIYKLLIDFSPLLCGAFIGGMWCIFVIFGAHRALVPIGINDVAQMGRQNLLAFAGAANFSQAGAALGVFFKTKNDNLKTISLSASITALFGITEPAIYGANLRLKKPMICAVICGAIGGGIMGFGGAFGNAFANQGVLTIPVYASAGAKGFISYLIGCAIAFFGSAILTYIIGFEDVSKC